MTMTLLTVVALAVACGLGAMLWIQRRDERERSAARVAALAATIDGEAGLDTFATEAPGFGASWQASATPSRRGWIVAAGTVPVLLAVAALLVTRGPSGVEPPTVARQPESLELLDMRHARAGDLLTVTGTVRVRGRDTAPVTAIVTGRDDAGRIIASAHAPLDDASLDIAGESSFQVSVIGGHVVRRYQVRFETPLGPLVHVDRRAGPRAAATP